MVWEKYIACHSNSYKRIAQSPQLLHKMAVSKKTRDERHPLKSPRLLHKMSAPKKIRDEKKLGMSDIQRRGKWRMEKRRQREKCLGMNSWSQRGKGKSKRIEVTIGLN
jgi:hypothetical protein